MQASQAYILVAIIALLIIAIVMFFVRKNKKQEKLTHLAGISFVFIIAGMLFGDSRAVGYTLIGIGILLALIDIFRKMRK